jgi:hypothetical protein
MLQGKGVDGVLTFDGETVNITRKGVLAALSHGLAGQKSIPIGSVTAVQFKKSGLTSGFLQLSIRGGREAVGGVFNAANDENTMLFVKKHEPDFERMRSAIQTKIAELAKPSVASAAQGTRSSADELEKLAGLRERGILSEEEFQAEKRRVLSS